MDKTPIVGKDSWLAGNMRYVLGSMAVLAFLVILGLMVVSGHSTHLYVAVGFLLLAAYLIPRAFPARHPDDDITQTGESKRQKVTADPQPMGCRCCEPEYHDLPED